MYRLTNAIRAYAWGSRTHIPRLLGTDPGEEPSAELWLGAHHGDPSMLPDGRSLLQAVGEEPAFMLGERTRAMFGDRLPFLMKVLAAAEPLSLQVHPTSERARLGFAEEDAAGIALDAPNRSYKDTSHKPELIFALTRFEGMAGFRDLDRTAAILRLLDLDWLDEYADELEHSDTPFQTLRDVVTRMLATSGDELADRIRRLGEAARAAEEIGHKALTPTRRAQAERDSVERESVRVFAQTQQLAARYPQDAGVLVTLLLNHVVLAAGEAMYLDAGVIHAYTSGLGVEVMASSDNVLRAGLTPKHMDVPELLAITDFTPMPAPLWTSSGRDPRDGQFAPPVAEFTLRVTSTPVDDLPGSGPRIVLVLDGDVTLTSDLDEQQLTAGESVFVGHGEGPLRVQGQGRVAVAAVPGG